MAWNIPQAFAELYLIPGWRIDSCWRCGRLCINPFSCVFNFIYQPTDVLLDDNLDDVTLEEASIETDHIPFITFE